MSLELGINAFIDINDADAYFLDNIQADAWAALTFDKKSQALITAGGQINLSLVPTCQFTIAEVDINSYVALANAELALAFALKPSSAGNSNTGSNIKKVGAGSAGVEFFSPTKGSRYPTEVSLYLTASGCLASAASCPNAGGIDYGTDQESIFSEPDYLRDRGFQ